MRRLVWLVIVFGLLWCGWWVFVSIGLQSGIQQWFKDRHTEGWQADFSDVQVSGFPFALRATITDPALADPQTGIAFEASQLVISARAWWPGHATVLFPDDEMVFATPLERRSIVAKNAKADLKLRPGTALELEEMSFTSGLWELNAPQGSLMAAKSLILSAKQSQGDRTEYTFTLDAPAFQPGSIPRQILRVPDDWPIGFDSLALDATIRFNRAFDRTTIENSRPQPQHIDLRLAEAVWGALLLRKAANLDVSDQGLLSGDVMFQARGWTDMLTLAETSGALHSTMRPQLENVLGALARGSGSPDAIDVTLALRDGKMFLGFIPLGQAPRVILR